MLSTMLLLKRARRRNMSRLLAVVAHLVRGGCCHQCTLDDIIGVVSNVQVCGKMSAEVVENSLQCKGVRWCWRSAPNNAGGLLVAERIVG